MKDGIIAFVFAQILFLPLILLSPMEWRREFQSLSREVKNIMYDYYPGCRIRNGPHVFLVSNDLVKIFWETNCDKKHTNLFIREGNNPFQQLKVLKDQLSVSHFTFQTDIQIKQENGYQIIVITAGILK